MDFLYDTTGKAIKLDFSIDSLNHLALSNAVGPNQKNTPDDVELVSWLLFFYFLNWDPSFSPHNAPWTSGLDYAQIQNYLDNIMTNTSVYTQYHTNLIKGLQRALGVKNPTGVIQPQSSELVILVKHMLPFAQIIGQYNCSYYFQQALNPLNPNSNRNKEGATAALVVLSLFLADAEIINLSKRFILAAAKRILSEEGMEGATTLLKGQADSLTGGNSGLIMKLGQILGGLPLIRSTRLKNIFTSPWFYVAAGIGIYAYHQHQDNQKCLKDLNFKVEQMRIDMNNMRRDNQRYEELQDKINAGQQKVNEKLIEQQKFNEKVINLLKHHGLSFSGTLLEHKHKYANQKRLLTQKEIT